MLNFKRRAVNKKTHFSIFKKYCACVILNLHTTQDTRHITHTYTCTHTQLPGSFFLEFVHFFKMYGHYASNHSKVCHHNKQRFTTYKTKTQINTKTRTKTRQAIQKLRVLRRSSSKIDNLFNSLETKYIGMHSLTKSPGYSFLFLLGNGWNPFS